MTIEQEERIEVEAPESAEFEQEFTKEKPLQIKRIKQNKDGKIDILISLSPHESFVLLRFAIGFLISQGLLSFLDVEKNTDETDQETIVLGERLK